MSFGDYKLGATIHGRFTTRAGTPPQPTSLLGTPSVVVYVGNSTTKITAGVTLSVDHDAKTGMNLLEIVATAANGYATGTDYNIMLDAGTVGGTPVQGEVVGHFSIEKSAAYLLAVNLNKGIILGSAKTGTLSTTQFTSTVNGYTLDAPVGRLVTWLPGSANHGQQKVISAYDDTGSGGLISVDAGSPWTTAPLNNDEFKIT